MLQLELFPTLAIHPTIAMRRGDSHLAQCAWCGTLVCSPSTANHQLGACPSCAHPDGRWWKQTYHSVGPFRFGQPDPSACAHCGDDSYEGCMCCVECGADLDDDDHLDECPELVEPARPVETVGVGSYL